MESKELPDYQKLCQSFIPLPQFLCLFWLPSWIRKWQREVSNRSCLVITTIRKVILRQGNGVRGIARVSKRLSVIHSTAAIPLPLVVRDSEQTESTGKIFSKLYPMLRLVCEF
jgi:hypothetical protein